MKNVAQMIGHTVTLKTCGNNLASCMPWHNSVQACQQAWKDSVVTLRFGPLGAAQLGVVHQC